MRHDAELHHRRRRGRLLALTEGGGDIITSIFADGTDGFYFDFSKTDRLFQNQTLTPADDAGENIGLALEGHAWGGRTLASWLASQSELVTNGGFSADTNWTKGTGFSISGGTLNATAGSGSNADQAGILTVGAWYQVSYEVTAYTAGSVQLLLGSGSAILARASVGVSSGIFQCTGNTTLYVNKNASFAGSIDNVSVKRVSGNHGLQATTAAQPKWQTGGLARFDGSDDALVTTLTPATAMTLMFKGKLKDILSASVFYVMGSRVTAGNDRFYFGFDNSGRLTATIGGTVLTRTGSLEATVGVGAVVLSGGVGTLYWNAVEGASGAVGTPNTTVPFALGAIYTSGTPSAFFKDDIYYALAIKKALAAAQIAAVTNKWGTS